MSLRSVVRAGAALLVVAAGACGGGIVGWILGMLPTGNETVARALAFPGGAFGAMYAAWVWRKAAQDTRHWAARHWNDHGKGQR